jgi:small subunit ribosomal protein S21
VTSPARELDDFWIENSLHAAERNCAFGAMKEASFYEKPSERATREKSEAIRRARKLARKHAIREGLIAAPVKKLSNRRPARALPSVGPTKPQQR